MGQAGTTRAVVIGVSTYQNERIPRLQFAHHDADAFAAYLRSPAGGALPATHLKVLTNEQATQGKMAAGLTWLMEESKEGDNAIIYFSGHGDMENQTMANHGFLLTYDAPATTYMAGGAFPIFYLQSIIQTLSAQKKARVILITDACHAGKLAGSDNGGPQATAKVLADQFSNEAKILSCQPNEFSIEGREWGGGHGVFTYFLIDGLTGLADGNDDQSVTLLELQRFLEDHVPAAVAPRSQIPLVFGDKAMAIAKVDQAALAALKVKRAREKSTPTSGELAARSVPKPANADSTMILYGRFQEALQNKHLLYPEENAAYTLYNRLRDRPEMAEYRQGMRLDLAAALQDDAQQAINDYLAANPRELSRRWSYDNRYDQYPTYLEKAAEVLGVDHFQYQDLRAKSLYFAGVNLRLQGERLKEPDNYQRAIALQQEVLRFDSTAAYAYNELGLLARRQKDFAASIVNFEKALDFSPTWVLAKTNLCGSLTDLDQPEAAIQACRDALEHDSTFALAHHNFGVALLNQSQRREAIAAFQSALTFDSTYYLTYVKLGEAFYFNEQAEQALGAWKQVVRLAPDNKMTWYNLGVVSDELGRPTEALEFYKTADALDPDAHTKLDIADLEMSLGRFAQAQAVLQAGLQLAPDLADTYYLQARLHALQGDTQQALDALETALQKGYRDREKIQADTHLDPLRQTERFQQLMKQYFP